MNNDLLGFLDQKDVEYKRNEPMSRYTSIRIGGSASVIAFPSTEKKLIELYRFIYENNLKYKFIGRMTNILPCDGVYSGVLISTAHLNRYTFYDAVISAECGVLMAILIARMARLGIGGLEALSGIPGSVGGMIYSNAGAFGKEISDFFLDARLYDVFEDKIYTFSLDMMKFGYRESILKQSKLILLSARFRFSRKNTDIILDELGKIKCRRRLTQPLEYPSLGSVFKKNESTSAAELIDRCKLKGYRIGGAEVSDKHAGFIINRGEATAQNFKDLVSVISDVVYSKTGAQLQREVEYL